MSLANRQTSGLISPCAQHAVLFGVMSFYFSIISPSDVPLFSVAFGSFKAGGDGIARFRYPADSSSRYMNQFLVHASLDILEEVQWRNGAM